MSASETDSNCPKGIMSLVLANNHLAVNLHRLLTEEKGNVFFSPFSISTAMAMLLSAAEGDTESEMRTALGYDHTAMETEAIPCTFKQLNSLLLKDLYHPVRIRISYTLHSANSMLIQKGFNVKDGYKMILADSFAALLLEVDFQNENEKTVKQVNEWVKEKTNNMISKLVQSLDPDTVIVLLNAVYFKGRWLQKFEKQATYPQPFYNKGNDYNVKQVDMMHMEESFPFYEDVSLQALQLPYIGKEVSMFVLLPCKKNGLESLEASLTSSFVEELMRKMRKKKVEIHLPRFRLEYTKSLIPCFKQLGINRVFSRGAELGTASDSPDLAVSDILHKAVLEVNEEASTIYSDFKSTAKLDFTLGPKTSFDPMFVADHPFAFIIYDTRMDLILFMGRVDEL